jgi:hypothetical protein
MGIGGFIRFWFCSCFEVEIDILTLSAVGRICERLGLIAVWTLFGLICEIRLDDVLYI